MNLTKWGIFHFSFLHGILNNFSSNVELQFAVSSSGKAKNILFQILVKAGAMNTVELKSGILHKKFRVN